MKREFLQNFKVNDQPLPKEAIDAIMAENGRDIEAAKKPFADYDDLKRQLAEAGETIDSFKAMDIEGVKNAAEEWKRKAEQAEREAAEKIASMQFESLVDAAVTSAKGRSAKAIKALLDMDALKASKNQEADVKSALEALKKDNDYLFDTESAPPPYAAGTGTNPVNTKYSPGENAIRAAAGGGC